MPCKIQTENKKALHQKVQGRNDRVTTLLRPFLTKRTSSGAITPCNITVATGKAYAI